MVIQIPQENINGFAFEGIIIFFLVVPPHHTEGAGLLTKQLQAGVCAKNMAFTERNVKTQAKHKPWEVHKQQIPSLL